MLAAAVCIILLSPFVSCNASAGAPPAARKGVLDLTQTPGPGTVSLDGEWEFHWMKHITPGQKKDTSVSAPDSFIEVPGSWNGRLPGGKDAGGEGFGTYRLRVLLPGPVPRPLALEVGEVGTAYRLYVNGKLLGGKGVAGTGSWQSRPETIPDIYFFTPGSVETEIVIHVSNYHYRMGGLWQSLTLGDAETMLRKRNITLFLEAFFAGILFVMALYHIIIAVIHRREPASLFFGLACLDIALRQLVIGNKLALMLFPWLPWEVYLRVEYFSIGLAVPLFARYVKYIFPDTFPSKALHVFNAICVIFCAIVIAAPSRLYTETIIFYEGVVIVFIACGVVAAVKSIGEGNRDAPRVLLPGILFGATAVNDILFSNGIINTANLISPGLFIFIFSQALLLARRYAHSFDKAETLSGILTRKNENLRELNRELVVLKRGLEEKVVERTRDLEIARDRAEGASRAKSAFLANMSHELRTPLNAILGFSELLVMQNDVREKDRESARHIRDAGEYLLSVVSNVLDMSKIEAGKTTADMKPVDMASLLKGIPPSMKTLADRKGLRFSVSLGDDIGTVSGDETKLRQIVLNLVSNAVKFTPEGGELGLEAAAAGDRMTITVWDRGVGIDARDLARIFEPFEQVTTKEDGKPGGTGLGLPIARMLAELHGGTLTAKSEPGRGSRFILELPRASAHAAVQGGSVPGIAPPYAGNDLAGNILVVEDNELILKLFESMLTTTSLRATYATRGDEAVRLATDGRTFDIILMDIQLPGKDGVTALHEIREKLGEMMPPVIALTAHALEGDRDRFLSQGFSDYLAKPFGIEDLMRKIRGHLG
jgi:signal transduction histidine kinase/CheY-like chemotaxis protein